MRQASISPAEFEPANLASKLPQTHALARAAAGSYIAIKL